MSVTEGITEINVSYLDAVKLIENKFFFMNTRIAVWDNLKEDTILTDDCTQEKYYPEIDIPVFIEKLFVAAEVGNSNKIQTIASEIFTVLKARRYTEMKLKGFCSNILIEIFRKAYDHYPTLKDVVSMNEERIAELYDKKSNQLLSDYFILQLNMLSEHIAVVIGRAFWV